MSRCEVDDCTETGVVNIQMLPECFDHRELCVCQSHYEERKQQLQARQEAEDEFFMSLQDNGVEE